MIYTSYFDKIEFLPDNIIPISICGKAPIWYKGLQYKKLAPKLEFFNKWRENHDNDYYIKCYNDQILDKLDILIVLGELHDITTTSCKDIHGKELCLICYEKPSEFCHRHLVANWLNKHDITCEEYKF